MDLSVRYACEQLLEISRRPSGLHDYCAGLTLPERIFVAGSRTLQPTWRNRKASHIGDLITARMDEPLLFQARLSSAFRLIT